MLKNKKFILIIIVFLLILIIGILASIRVLNSKNSGAVSIFDQSPPSSLKGYDKLKNDFVDLRKDTSISSIPTYQKLIPFIQVLGDTKLSEKDRFTKVFSTVSYTIDLYQLTNNPKVKPLYEDLKNYTKENAPKYYKPALFDAFCQDPSCAEHPQPVEITKAINELKVSDIDPTIRDSMIMDLNNNSYIEDKYRELKFNNYMGIAAPLYESDTSFSKSLVTKQIGKELLDYLKITFPDLYHYKAK